MSVKCIQYFSVDLFESESRDLFTCQNMTKKKCLHALQCIDEKLSVGAMRGKEVCYPINTQKKKTIWLFSKRMEEMLRIGFLLLCRDVGG